MEGTTVEHTEANVQQSALESEFKQLRERHKARFEQIAELMSSIQSLSDSTQAERESLESLEQSAQGQLLQLKNSLNETTSDRASFEARIQELTDALAAAERDKAELLERAGVEQDSAELASLQAELDAKNGAVASLEERVASLQGDLDETTRRAGELESRLAALQEESTHRMDDTASHQEQITRLEAEIAEKDRLLHDAQAALGEVQEEQDRVNAAFERLQMVQQQAEAAQEGMKTELMAVQRELESLKDKYREGLSSDAALALRQQVTETAAQVTALQVELLESREQGKKSVLAQQLADAMHVAEQLEEDNERLRQQLGLLEDESHILKGGGGKQSVATHSIPEPQVSRSPADELLRIQRAAQNWTHGPKRVIGQILLDAGVITAAQLETALDLQRSTPHQHLGALLSELGFASDEAIAQARASQCGVEYIRFKEDTVDPNAASLISERLATQHVCIPISASDRSMVLAVANPMDLLAIEDVERFTNKKVDVVVSTGPEIEQAIARYYWEPE